MIYCSYNYTDQLLFKHLKPLCFTVKVLRSDNRGEYTSDEFKKHLKLQGIKHESSESEQNGLAERLNRTQVEMVRSMLADS